MLTRIDNDADHFATLQAVDLDTNAKFPTLLEALSRLAPEGEDFEIILRLDLLPDSYRANPSMLAKNALAKMDEFESYGTYAVGPRHTGIKFMRGERPDRHHFVPVDRQSVMTRTRAWLDSDKESPLVIPIAEVPLSILARPEQFVYAIKRITDVRIRIQKLKTFIRITLHADA